MMSEDDYEMMDMEISNLRDEYEDQIIGLKRYILKLQEKIFTLEEQNRQLFERVYGKVQIKPVGEELEMREIK